VTCLSWFCIPYNLLPPGTFYLEGLGLLLSWGVAVVVQWLVLRRQDSPPPSWALLNAVNLAIAGLAIAVVTYPLLFFAFHFSAGGDATPMTLVPILAVIGAFGGAAGGIFSGLVTAFVLRALLKPIILDSLIDEQRPTRRFQNGTEPPPSSGLSGRVRECQEVAGHRDLTDVE
jgi:hypothetical protein